MLQFKSFDIKEGEKISEFLKDKTLATNATILITNGYIGIPYEDGEDLTIEQQIVRVKELKNTELTKIRMIYEHDVRKMEVKIDGLNKEIGKLEASVEEKKSGNKKKDYDLEKEVDKQIKVFENMIKQAETSITQTKAQMTDSAIEIAIYDEEIHLLEEKLKRD